jgi:hypothetical protein
LNPLGRSGPGVTRADLAKKKVPRAVIWGAKDTVDSVGSGRASAAALGVSLELGPRAGHLSVLANPTRVAELILKRPTANRQSAERARARCARMRFGENADVPAYTLNQEAVRHAKRLIDQRQYVLRSRWQNVQPRARQQNAFLKATPGMTMPLGISASPTARPRRRRRATRSSTATSAVCTAWG